MIARAIKIFVRCVYIIYGTSKHLLDVYLFKKTFYDKLNESASRHSLQISVKQFKSLLQ